MGLPGSGKTWLASRIVEYFQTAHFDGDAVRAMFNHWDFSPQGRINHTARIKQLAGYTQNSICSYVCPTQQCRDILDPDAIIWVDTIKESRYEDTNDLFEPPEKYDVRITEHINEDQLYKIFNDIFCSVDGHDTSEELELLVRRLASQS